MPCFVPYPLCNHVFIIGNRFTLFVFWRAATSSSLTCLIRYFLKGNFRNLHSYFQINSLNSNHSEGSVQVSWCLLFNFRRDFFIILSHECRIWFWTRSRRHIKYMKFVTLVHWSWTATKGLLTFVWVLSPSRPYQALIFLEFVYVYVTLQVSVDFIRLKSYENDQSLGEIKIIGLEVCCFNVTIRRVIIIIIIIISISITIISVQSLDVKIIYWSPDSRFDPVCIFVDEKLDVSTHLHNLLHLVAVPRLCCIYSQNVMQTLA